MTYLRSTTQLALESPGEVILENGSAFNLATVTSYNVAGQPSWIDSPGYGPGSPTTPAAATWWCRRAPIR